MLGRDEGKLFQHNMLKEYYLFLRYYLRKNISLWNRLSLVLVTLKFILILLMGLNSWLQMFMHLSCTYVHWSLPTSHSKSSYCMPFYSGAFEGILIGPSRQVISSHGMCSHGDANDRATAVSHPSPQSPTHTHKTRLKIISDPRSCHILWSFLGRDNSESGLLK